MSEELEHLHRLSYPKLNPVAQFSQVYELLSEHYVHISTLQTWHIPKELSVMEVGHWQPPFYFTIADGSAQR